MAGTVLIVEDNVDFADAYATWLSPNYHVWIAYTVEEATATLDAATDVVLLDRRLPDGTGVDVVSAIEDRELRCRVAMLTAVEPDFDVLELPIQEYMVKPVSEDELRSRVDRLMSLAEYDEYVREIYALASKKAALDAAKSQRELAASPAYRQLERRLETAKRRADETFDDLSGGRDFRDLYVDLRAGRI